MGLGNEVQRKANLTPGMGRATGPKFNNPTLTHMTNTVPFLNADDVHTHTVSLGNRKLHE